MLTGRLVMSWGSIGLVTIHLSCGDDRFKFLVRELLTDELGEEAQ